MSKAKGTTEPISVRVPVEWYFIIDKLAVANGIGTSTQLKVLVSEALKHRKLIK